MPESTTVVWLHNLNALVGGLFLLVTFGLVAVRQTQGCVRLFTALSVLLGVSAFLLSEIYSTWHLVVMGFVDIGTKAIIIPWLLRRSLPDEVYTRREVTQVLNIPTALLIALALAITAYLFTKPLLAVDSSGAIGVNLPIGFAGMLIGGLTAAVRREAVPLFLGLLAMENSAFLAGIGVAPEMPLIAEVAIAFDVLILVFAVSVLTRTVHEHIGTTEVGALTALREEPLP
jgi:hydrogenase-4 membrane subunit HyfE